jgi:hypothetical protein
VRRRVADAAGGILGLQRAAGNRAVAAILSREADMSKAPVADTRVDELFAAIESENRDRVFECAHADHPYLTQVATDYQTRHHVTIEEHLKAKLQRIDVVRALSYLRFGELRVADKLTIAVADTGFDMDALRRLLPQVRATSLAVVEQVMTQEHVPLGVLDAASPYTLPYGQPSLLAGILEAKWFKKDATKVEYLALLAYGEYRQADKVMAALMGATIDTAAIRRLVEKAPDRAALLAEFNASWGKDPGFDLISRLAGSGGASFATDADSMKTLDNKDLFLAVFLLRGKGGLLDRMKIATKGWDDLSILWDYLQDLPPAQRKAVRESEATGADYERREGGGRGDQGPRGDRGHHRTDRFAGRGRSDHVPHRRRRLPRPRGAGADIRGRRGARRGWGDRQRRLADRRQQRRQGRPVRRDRRRGPCRVPRRDSRRDGHRPRPGGRARDRLRGVQGGDGGDDAQGGGGRVERAAAPAADGRERDPGRRQRRALGRGAGGRE